MKYGVFILISVFFFGCSNFQSPQKDTRSIPELKESLKKEIDPEEKNILEKLIQERVKETDNSEYGEFTDPRDGQTYKTILMRDGRVWMAENMTFEIDGMSWCPNGKTENCVRYGRLYTWEAAKSVCPQGWHLPSDEEWWTLINEYGGAKDSYRATTEGEPRYDATDGKAAYWDLKVDGHTKFNAQLGGNRSQMFGWNEFKFRMMGEWGAYWTSSPINDKLVYYYGFRTGKLERNVSSGLNFGYSCRCIKDE